MASAAWVAGCTNEPDPPSVRWTLVDTDSLTGFYVGRIEGGLITIRIEDYERLAKRLAATPPLPTPIEVYGNLYPDDADTVLPLTGSMYGSQGTTYFTLATYHYPGPVYQFSGTYSDLGLSFGGAFTSQADTGYFGGYVGSMDSVQVYCGAFTGDTLQGQWHFAVRAPFLRGAGVAIDTSVFLAYDGTVTGPGATGSVSFVGTANGELTLSGAGTLDGETASGTWALSGSFDSGTWTADRMRADSVAVQAASRFWAAHLTGNR